MGLDIEPHNGRRQYRKKVPGLKHRIGGQRLLIWLVLNFMRIVAPVGRRFGKTTGLLFVILELAARTAGKCYIGIWNSDHDKAAELMEVFITAYGGDPKDNPESLIRHIKRGGGQNRYFELHPIWMKGHEINEGVRVYFWSSTHPAYNRVRGYTHPFHLIVSDESSYVHGNAILKVSLKMLADCGGKFLAIGTPDIDGAGFAWFSTFWSRAMSEKGEWKDWAGMNFPSEANPTIPFGNIETMRAECMSEEEEKQEIDAIFLEDTSSVFGALKYVFTLKYFQDTPSWATDAFTESGITRDRYRLWVHDQPRSGVYYVMGVDWARKVDRTVITIFRQDTCYEVLRAELDGEDWDEQMKVVRKLRYLFGDCSIYSDASGVGEGMTNLLKVKYNEPVTEVNWKGFQKERSVRTMSQLFRTKSVQLINCVDSREEFRLYHGEPNPRTGRIVYMASDGQHDDHVDATLMLTEPLLAPIRPPQDEDGAEVEPERPPPGTMAEVRMVMDEESWVDEIAEAQI